MIYFRYNGKTYKFDMKKATKLGTDRWNPRTGNENRYWDTIWKSATGKYVICSDTIYQDGVASWRVATEREVLEMLSDPGMTLTEAGEEERELLAAKYAEEL